MTLRRGLLAASIVLIVLGLTVARPAKTWGPLLRDFEAYWSAGQTYDTGGNPYGRDIWRAEMTVPEVDANRNEVLPFVSPPATLPMWRAISRLLYDVASRLWWVTMVAAMMGLIALTLRASGERVTLFLFFSALTLAVGFGPVTSNLALGQIAIVAFFGATFVACRYEWPVLNEIAAFVAFFQPNVALGLLSQLGRNRTTFAIVVGGIASYVVGALVMGWNWPITYLELVRAHNASERFSALQLTVGAIAHGLHASPAVETLATVAAALAAVAAAVAIWRTVEDRFARFAAISALLPFVATFYHEHDLITAFPAAIWCAVRTRGTARLAGLFGTLLAAIDWLGLAQRSEATAQSALLATGALVAFVALGEETDFRVALRGALPVAALFAVAAWLGSANPLPVWPYHLGSFHPLATLPVSTVWMLEQERNGILAIVPPWSLLRALSLAGCALLAVAIYLHSPYRRRASTLQDANP
jgi:hypothetical protein